MGPEGPKPKANALLPPLDDVVLVAAGVGSTATWPVPPVSPPPLILLAAAAAGEVMMFWPE